MRVATAAPPAEKELTTLPRDFHLRPNIGRWTIELSRFARLLANPEVDTLLKLADMADELSSAPMNLESLTAERLRFAFVLSLLHDILSVGGRVRVIDSEIYVSWPDWGGIEGRVLASHALDGFADRRILDAKEAARLGPLFMKQLEKRTLIRFLREARFWLEPAEAVHPSGVRYGDGFSLALRLWRMPYRGRQGRMRRFVVVAQHPHVSRDPVIAGLIEVGDDAPYSVERDQFLTLRSGAALAWLQSQPNLEIACQAVKERLGGLRMAVLPIAGIGNVAASEILANERELLSRALGRSQSDVGFVTKKRIAYLVRLAHGEEALERLASGAEMKADDAPFRQGVRALHNLIVPRVHMEATVCGAVPPFGAGLGGKLIVSFLAHPQIRAVASTEPGAILRDLFDLSRLDAAWPNWGVLALTTKGLYPGHSALYNRGSVPGIAGDVRLRRIGKTRGTTTTFLGARSARIAQQIMRSLPGQRQVSMIYGTGGAKRQRVLESAVLTAGLPEAFVHAGIRRPVYGLNMVSNLADIVWGSQPPKWIVDPAATAEQYSDSATAMWRQRWFNQVERRLGFVEGDIPGFFDELHSGDSPLT
jgi:hypothetical protein